MTRVFIISSHLMFGYGLESLLRQETEIDIIGQEADLDRALEQIEAIQPDVIILDTHKSKPDLMAILTASPGIKVIGLSLQNNNLYIYRVTQGVAKSVQDLVEAIEDEPASSEPRSRTDHPRDEERGLSAQQ